MRISDWSSDVCSSDLTYSDLAPGEGHSYGRQIGISNDTSVDLGGFTIRNIFGFRKNRKDEAINPGANGPLSITIDGVTSPFILFHGSAVEERKYITDDAQLLGTAMEVRLSWSARTLFGNDATTQADSPRWGIEETVLM